ncbi:MAG: type I restriction enzyme HsdR N-terminal domain-containing protein [Muribaculaceae bacterium]|nr:type I restriction enzyme HsdR N-terminal domain-containing protein [Muribaculaceae bacterium]
MDWNFICKIIRNIDKQSEIAYQRGIKEMILEVGLGWNSEQITEQLSLQLGSTERLVPDILVQKDERNSFIIEVKKPGHKKTNGDIEQLLSYMKQMEIPVGIYWGDEVEVYWKTIGDGSAPILLLNLNFNVLCEDGHSFVSLFSEVNYSLDAMRAFKEECETKKKFDSEVNNLLEEVTATEFNETVKGLISNYFLDRGIDEDVVKTVMSKVQLCISDKRGEEDTDRAILRHGIPMEFSYQSRSRRSVGARPFAYNLMRKIIEKNRNLSFGDLYALFKKRNYVEEVATIDEKRMGRWFLLPDEIITLSDGTKVAISNQWGFNNNSKPKMDLLRSIAEKFDIDATLPD